MEQTKKEYLPPRIISVGIRLERGFTGSSVQGSSTHDNILLDIEQRAFTSTGSTTRATQYSTINPSDDGGSTWHTFE